MDLKNLILAANDLSNLTPVDVPQWPETKGKLFVKQLSAAAQEAYELSLRKFVDATVPTNFAAGVVALVLCDEKGNLIFSPADVPSLAQKSGKAIDAIFKAWQDASGLSKKATDEGKEGGEAKADVQA